MYARLAEKAYLLRVMELFTGSKQVCCCCRCCSDSSSRSCRCSCWRKGREKRRIRLGRRWHGFWTIRLRHMYSCYVCINMHLKQSLSNKNQSKFLDHFINACFWYQNKIKLKLYFNIRYLSLCEFYLSHCWLYLLLVISICICNFNL